MVFRNIYDIVSSMLKWAIFFYLFYPGSVGAFRDGSNPVLQEESQQHLRRRARVRLGYVHHRRQLQKIWIFPPNYVLTNNILLGYAKQLFFYFQIPVATVNLFEMKKVYRYLCFCSKQKVWLGNEHKNSQTFTL